MKEHPNLRFKEFNDNWEQHKLGDLIIGYNKKTTTNNQYPMLTSSQRHGIILQDQYFNNKNRSSKNNIGYFILPKGFFTYRNRSDNGVFRFNRNDIIDKGIISYFYPVFSVKESIDSTFFLNSINETTKKDVFIESEGTGQHVLSFTKLKKINVQIPSREEQVKIGEIFSTIQNIMSLQQKKLEKLHALRKFLLQRLFTNDKYPQARLQKFSDPWKKYQLGDISNKVTTKNTDNKPLPVFTNSAKRGIIDQETFFDKRIANNTTKYYIIHNDDFVYNPRISTSAPFGPIRRNTLQKTGVMSPLYYVFSVNKNINLSFLSYYFLSSSWHRFMYENGDSGARSDRFSIKDTILQQMPIYLPSLEEQSKISNIMKQVDTLIDLQSKKLDKLHLLKKFLLQQMFI